MLVSAPVGHILTTLYLLRLCEAGTGDVTEMERILPPARAADPAILANPPHTATNIMSTNIVNKQNFSKNILRYFREVFFCDDMLTALTKLSNKQTKITIYPNYNVNNEKCK